MGHKTSKTSSRSRYRRHASSEVFTGVENRHDIFAAQGATLPQTLPRSSSRATTRSGAAPSGKLSASLATGVAGAAQVKGKRKSGGVSSEAAQRANKPAPSNPRYEKLLSSVRHQVAKLKYEQHLLEVAGQDGQRSG